MKEVVVGVDAGTGVWIGVDLTREELRRMGVDLPDGHETASFVLEAHLARLGLLFARALTSGGGRTTLLHGAIVIKAVDAQSLRKDNASLAALPSAARQLGERLSKADLLEVAWDLIAADQRELSFGDEPTPAMTLNALIQAVQERRRVGGRVPLTPRECGRPRAPANGGASGSQRQQEPEPITGRESTRAAEEP